MQHPPRSESSPRLFVALMLGAEPGEEVAAAARAALGGEAAAREGFRLPRPDGLHLTLFFLGPVAGERVPGLRTALARGLDGAPAPRLRLARAGAFPRPGRERVLWVGVEDRGAGELGRLHARVLDAVEAAGFDAALDRARPFRPHVTVARPRRGSVPASFYALEVDRVWEPREACLVESVRADGPALYRPMARFPLHRAKGPAEG